MHVLVESVSGRDEHHNSQGVSMMRRRPWVQLISFKYYGNGKVPHGSREVGSF
jgi:hypothetical protein